jgi:predicted Zn-dependent protease
MARALRWRWQWCICVLVLLGIACETVPITGRQQFNLISEQQEMQLGTDAYAEVLKEHALSTHGEWQRRLKAVGARIQAAAEKPDFAWEFNVLVGKDINAFCLPGGKVAFWEGIMPVCGSDAGIAVVMGHEVAHAIAHHGAERMTQSLSANAIGTLLQIGLGGVEAGTRDTVMRMYGLGAQVGVMLPFSRSHESEADRIGLLLMARAGYDPREAVEFWKRMAAAAGGQAPPEFLSTHPGTDTRIRNLQSWMPEALEAYNDARPR